ncbi:DEAD/DEAH box helicase [Streptosporangium sp. NPDC050855]|uniref:Lhr family helicase n=1 Tax=Streptosporangium sp. NPDC050855 TaxID=3366194 RepID=UPI0037B83D53
MSETSGTDGALGHFTPMTREWFTGAFAAPTAAQEGAWSAIARGDNTLVVAPTGSGKTLAAFLWSLDRLAAEHSATDAGQAAARTGDGRPLTGKVGTGRTGDGTAGDPTGGERASGVRAGGGRRPRGDGEPPRLCRVLYVSPLKALAVDVERNLRAPLAGLEQTARRLGLPVPRISVSIRSGDTPAEERRRFATKPSDILITTPESLFLLLTSQAREALRGVETVIVDEVHAVAATKRGAHLALSLERLDALLERPAQRIGLSATVRPVSEVAAFLGGSRPATVVQPPSEKRIEVEVVVPIEDMTELDTAPAPPPQDDDRWLTETPARRSIWPHVEERLLDLIGAHRSTIVFANSRRLAERLCTRLNELAWERRSEGTEGAAEDAGQDHTDRTGPGGTGPGGVGSGRAGHDRSDPEEADHTKAGGTAGRARPAAGSPPASTSTPAAMMAQAGAAKGVVPEIVRAHHGSVSKEERSQIEEALKSGRLPAVVATSSLELGIDMGAVDLVACVGAPPSVASGLQRIGRAGHQVGAVSRGVIFPKYRGDLVQTAVVAERMRSGEIEDLRYPRNPLDVLAQQIVAMTALDEWTVDELEEVVRRAAPYRTLPRSALEATLDMLAGRYPSEEFAELRPRIVWDRVTGTLRGRPGAQRLAVTNGGTIPDRGLFGVFLVGEKSSRVGELDEEMVYESRAGDVFVLGATSWRIEEITADRVLVTPAPGQPGKLPFWHGDTAGRPAELGRAIGAFLREMSTAGADTAGTTGTGTAGASTSGTGTAGTGTAGTGTAGTGTAGTGTAGSGTGNGTGTKTKTGTRTSGAADGATGGATSMVTGATTDPAEDDASTDPAVGTATGTTTGGAATTATTATAATGATAATTAASTVKGGSGKARAGKRGAEDLTRDDALGRIRAAGLDEFAAANLLAYLAEQRQATGYVPDDRTLVVERFHDELGDWRVVVHSPYGARVHAPWALAIGRRLRERYGVDVQAVHSDDGIVLRIPDTLSDPPSDIAIFDADEIERIVTEELGGSALFAARFRECAGRSLLLPRRTPGRRSPLWQQRQRASHLLGVAGRYGSFPVVLETMRECLQDVFDVPGLVRLMRDVEARRIRLVEVETEKASPFAASLLFNYIGAFMYEGDAPLAERRAQALALDTSLLAELLGQADLRELLDPDVIADTERELARLDRPLRDAEDLADLLRSHGPLLAEDVSVREGDPAWLAELEGSRRAIRVRVAGQERWAAIEDAARLRDALGVPLPVGVPHAFLEPVDDPLGDLLARHARTRASFPASTAATRFGLGPAVVVDALRRLAASGRVVSGEFRPGGRGEEWCDAGVLRTLRRRSLARLRKEVEPVPAETLAAFSPAWHGITGSPQRGRPPIDALVGAIEQLQGAAVPASALETLILPARVPGYDPSLLDELTASGEVIWAGQGSLPGGDGWVSLYFADTAPLLIPAPADITLTPVHEAVLEVLGGGGALFFRELTNRVGTLLDGSVPDDRTLSAAVWDLVWSGRITGDTLAPLRSTLGTGRPAHRPAPTRRRRAVLPTRSGPPTVSGRWWALPDLSPESTQRAHAQVEVLLERHGVVTRGAVTAERLPGGFAAVYQVLRAFEESGRCRRGYFVEGLGGAQFALPGAVDRMRAASPSEQRGPAPESEPWGAAPAPAPWETRRPERRHAGDVRRAVVLAAADPANPYGAALAWPARPEQASHKPGRKAGSLVVLVDGHLILYVERGGKTLLSFSADDRLQPAVDALALAVRDGALGKLTVERADGTAINDSPLGAALESAGFHPTPRGLRLRA